MEERDVKDFIPKAQSVDELVKQLGGTAFNGRKLGEATAVIEEMVAEKGCVKFLGLAGALVPAGMRSCIVEMIKNGWVDVIVSTGANITHDLTMAFGEKYTQTEPDEVDDLKLKSKSMNRIYDVVSHTETFGILEEHLQKILKKIPDGEYSSFEIVEEIGKRVSDKSSIVRAAADHGVKIVIPAFFDSILGFQVWMHGQDHKMSINGAKDLQFMFDIHYKLKDEKRNSGALILGGGVPKNYILQAVLIPEKPHRYVVQITTDTPVYGGLSGATLDEAKSWGKTDAQSKLCTVYCDATIALPIILSALKERLK